MIEIFLLIIWCHWVADFILQSDYIAKNKSKSNVVLLKHVCIYSIPFMVFLLVFPLAPVWIILNAILHFMVDWCTSRITSKLWAEQKVHNFFVTIGFDQALHMTCLVVTYQYMSSLNGWF